MTELSQKPSVEDFLAHHGIKGMHWGVRKKEDESGTSSSSPRTGSGSQPSSAQSQSETGRHGLSRNQKIALGVGGVALAAGLAYYGHKQLGINLPKFDAARIESGKNFVEHRANLAQTKVSSITHSGPWKTDPALSGKKSVDGIMRDVVKHINPEYGAPGTKTNCRRCTFAYELRRRGMDVAGTKSLVEENQHTLSRAIRAEVTGGSGGKGFTLVGHSTLSSMWGASEVSLANANSGNSSAQAIFRSLAKHPDGARGELTMGWKFGGGHSVAWEIVGGKPVIFDTQNGTHFRDAGSFSHIAGAIQHAGFTRLDNRDLDLEYLSGWVKPRA